MLKKIEHYHRAVANLSAAAAAYEASPENDLYLDALIQRFEITVELAWKSLRDYLEEEGIPCPLSTPRGVLKEAYTAGILADEDLWPDIVTSRNQTAHIYDLPTARRIAARIQEAYLAAFFRLDNFYQEKPH